MMVKMNLEKWVEPVIMVGRLLIDELLILDNILL